MSLQIIDTCNIPEYALPALINDDWSGIDVLDYEAIQEWLKKFSDYTGLVFSPASDSENVESFFSHSPAFGLPCTCNEYNVLGHKKDGFRSFTRADESGRDNRDFIAYNIP